MVLKMNYNLSINSNTSLNTGVKRKRSHSISPLQKAKSIARHYSNQTLTESDNDEYSGSDSSAYDDGDEMASEDDAPNVLCKRRKVETYENVPILVNNQLVLPKDVSKKVFKCEFQGCGKSYKKPSRLQEHERSHTGEVRIACPQ